MSKRDIALTWVSVEPTEQRFVYRVTFECTLKDRTTVRVTTRVDFGHGRRVNSPRLGTIIQFAKGRLIYDLGDLLKSK